MDRSIGDMPTLPGGSERSWKGILQPGSLFGRYRVHCFLGRGGMGEVYEVVHELDGAHYAMKVLSSEIPQTPENIRRFEREAQVMARLEHPNVISVDYFDETNGKYWFRMELVRGIEEGVVTLGDLAARNGGRIGQGLLVCLFEQILDGLSCAHEKGVIHRDLKPGNVLLAHSDELSGGIVAKISDFGLVRLVGQDWLLNKTLISTQQSLGERATEGTEDSQGLSTQSLVGTYAYMSPEQKQRRQVDERSDIYAVGLIIYRLLTGYTNPGERIRKKDSSLHAFWQRIVDQSVREDPEDRFASAAAMLVELRRGHRVLASLDGKASLKKSNVEFKAKRCYTANRYLEEASMIFPDDPEVLEFRAIMRGQLGILQELRTKMQNFRRLKEYDDALAVSEQFCAICIEDEGINKFIAEYPQLVIREQSSQLIEEASRLLETEEFEAASQAAQKALSLDPEDSRARQIHDQALAMLKKMQMQHTREQVSKGLQKTHSLLRHKRYAKALDALGHTPCSDSTHPTVIALRNACQSGLKKIRQYWERAEEARKSADYQGAISLLNEVLDGVAPEDPGTIERLNRLRSEVKELSAASTEMDLAWENRSYKKCLAAADRILAFQPDHPKAKECKLACADEIRIIQPYIDKAEEYYQNQQYDKAVAALEHTKGHYRLGKRTARDDAGIETQHTTYSPEYKETLDRIAAIRKAKASIEQALERAKERLEAGDLLETRLALNDYFELQTDGKEGLLLQQKLESLHRRGTIMRRIRRSVIYLAVAAVVGLGLAYGGASLVVTHRMQKALEESCTALTFANLKVTQREAGSQLDELRQSRFAPLFSIGERWKHWKDSLDRSGLAWEHYARGADEDGQSECENIPLTEFTPFIRHAFDTFVQDVNELCAKVNDQLVKGDYDICVKDCNVFLLNYPQHSRCLDLLKKAEKGRELERSLYDLSVNLTDLSYNLRALNEISPQHSERQKLEEQCIKTVEAKYDFLNRPPPTDVNDIEKELASCCRALDEEIIPFNEYHGYKDLHEELTDRKTDLEIQLSNMIDAEDVRDKLAEANSLIDQKCWVKTKQMLDSLDPAQDEVSRLKDVVNEKIKQLQELVKNAGEQVEQRKWLDAKETMSELWSIWNEDDIGELLTEAKELEARINESMQKEGGEIRAFAGAIDKKDHGQIRLFVQDHIGRTSDLTPIYKKWFPRLKRDVQDALAQHKINTALNHLSHVIDHEEIKRDVNDEGLSRLLQDMGGYKADADQKSHQALERMNKARALQNTQCVEALWHVHQALEINSECDDAQELQGTLQSKERLAAQSWREAKLFYDDKCYVRARRTLAPTARDFPGDARVTALLHDIDTKMKAADQAAENVKNRKLRVKEFYDNYVDYEFSSGLDRRVRKEILEDLENRIADPSQKMRRNIILSSRRQVLQDEPEYQALASKNSLATSQTPLKSEDLTDPTWCQIKFPETPKAIHGTIQIEGHGLKALGTVFVRSQDSVYIRVSSSSDLDCSRTQAISLKPWKVYRIKIRSTCLDMKEAVVQVVRKGWPFKEYDFDAMTDQIMTAHPIDKERAMKSLEAAFDRMKDKENLTTLRVPLIDCWQDEQLMEFEIEE